MTGLANQNGVQPSHCLGPIGVDLWWHILHSTILLGTNLGRNVVDPFDYLSFVLYLQRAVIHCRLLGVLHLFLLLFDLYLCLCFYLYLFLFLFQSH